MKQRIKNGKLIILALCAVMAFFMGFACLASTNYARAAEESVQTANADAFEMLESAEVRTESPYGIRFKARVGANVKTAIESVSNTADATNKGFLIFPKAYLASVSGENPDYKEQGVLTDYLDIPINNGTWYPEKDKSGNDTGYYLYNGVIHTIKENNRSLDFAAIAYYKDATQDKFVYANFNKDFGRSITYILSKAYLNDYTNAETLDEAFGTWFGTESNPIRITDAGEMAAFSAAVQGGYNFNGKTVALANDITVDGVAPIRSGFTGTFDYNGKTLTVLNGGDGIVKCGTKKNETTDSVVSDKAYAYKATEGTAKNVFNKIGTQKGEFNDAVDASSYNGSKSAKLVGLGTNASPTIELNYTKQELTQLKTADTYNQVTLQVKFVGSGISNNNTITGSDEKIPCILTKAGVNSTITVNTWLTYTISLEDFISTMGITFFNNGSNYTIDDNQTLLSKVWISGSTFDVYVGDIVLSKAEYGLTMGANYLSRLTVGNASGNTINHVATNQPAYVEKTDSSFPSGSYDGNAISGVIYAANKTYITMNYSAKDYAALTQYNTVSLNLYFEQGSEAGATAEFAMNGSITDTNGVTCLLSASTIKKGTWYKVSVSKDAFVSAMGGAESDSKTLFLVNLWLKNLDYCRLYVGDIEFSYKEPTLFIADSDNVNNNLSDAAFVENASIQEVFTDADGYTGNAVKLTRNRGQAINITLDINAEEITALKTKYSQVVFNFGVVYSTGVTSLNRNANFANGLIEKAGLTSKINDKVWYTKTISIDDFIVAVNANDTDSKTVFFMTAWTDPSTAPAGTTSSYDIYIGNIEFVTTQVQP